MLKTIYLIPQGFRPVWTKSSLYKLQRPTDNEGFQLSTDLKKEVLYEPRSEKTGLRGFRPGPTQTGLYTHIRWLELEIS